MLRGNNEPVATFASLARDWRGAAAPIFAVTAVAFIGLAGLATDEMVAGGDGDDSALPERNLGQSSEKASDPGEAARSARLSAGPPFAAREVTRPVISLVRCRRGVVAIEFVLLAPVLLVILFGTIYFGLALNNYLTLTNAAEQGAQTLSLGRGTSTPYSTAMTAIDSAATNLNTSAITQTVQIGGSSCSSDSACSTLLTAGAVASVALTYPCNLTFAYYNGGSCTLSTQSAAIVQ